MNLEEIIESFIHRDFDDIDFFDETNFVVETIDGKDVTEEWYKEPAKMSYEERKKLDDFRNFEKMRRGRYRNKTVKVMLTENEMLLFKDKLKNEGLTIQQLLHTFIVDYIRG